MYDMVHSRDVRVSPKNGPSSYTRPSPSPHSFPNLSTAELHEQLDTDLDDIDGWSEESEDIEIYKCTRPLRVKKKKINFTTGRVVTNRRHRRSTISGPRSPRSFTSASPKSPTLKRSCAAGPVSAHAHISQLFFALPATSPSPTMPDQYTSASSLAAKRSSGSSSLHLGLGRFASYDPICPGPSPPVSPAPSPITRTFSNVHEHNAHYSSSACTYERKRLPTIPGSPLTPSRAPRKAAELLGAIPPATISKGGARKHAASALKPGKHFRPLPNAAVTEIERFFGDVPRKPSKTPPGLKSKSNSGSSFKPKSKPSSHPFAAKPSSPPPSSRSGEDVYRKIDRETLGQGETVKHRALDGSMWLDVEEEQEFAWLMSDALTAVPPAPLPSVAAVEAKAKATRKAEAQAVEEMVRIMEKREGRQRVKQLDEMDVLCGSDGESEKWGMEAFTSILSIPKPKFVSTSTKSKSKFSRKKPSKTDISFLEVETPKHRDFDIATLQPWNRHIRSYSNPTPDSPKYEISDPIPLFEDMPSDFTVSRDISTTKRADSRSNSSSSKNGRRQSPSPPRVKYRPPPITVPQSVVNNRLPVLTATSPRDLVSFSPPSSRSQIQVEPIAAPAGMVSGTLRTTPFVRPRVAPAAPGPGHGLRITGSSPPPPLPLSLPILMPPVPPIPSLPTILAADVSKSSNNGELRSPAIIVSTSITGPGKSKDARESRKGAKEEKALISFFEPVTPIEPALPAGMKSKAWLKRVVKPLMS
ncbi:hypothetical protein I305_05724 [Cryptococcus gattii E566]|uniref:Uncharacterized protein n=1 Tax=Cryptococcus gattii EJB2 TaxID=1296103 RepID=A0ABR5C0X4_9TREE|nr:hypothetical protein I306_01374 [Cryptococcus gattii EJB2]KIY31767.1 hypothetical protein I305_05724 [Cryptococcus gattii E566]KJE02276.1 hypothetical protein I311_04158 [Cryptococcus gattii NT-10]